jgi:serine/threonine-protein kinase
MAPEVWQGGLHSIRSDLYAASAVFFEALTGHPPFTDLDVEVLRRQHTTSVIPETEVPMPARGLVLEGMAKDSGVRPVDATRTRADLATAAGAFLEDDWRERGRGWLVGAARHHRSRVPPPPPDDGVTAEADEEPEMEPALLTGARGPFWRNPRILAGIAAAVLAFVVIAVVAVAALSRGSSDSSGAGILPTTSASPGTSGSAPFTTSDVPSSSPSASGTSGTSTTQPTSTPIPTSSGQVTFTGAGTPTPTPTTIVTTTTCVTPLLGSPCPHPAP